MCFGNDEPPKNPEIAEAPPLQEMMDMIDEITGTQSVIVTGADGKKRRVNSRLPRSPEEDKRFKFAEKMISSTMQNIKTLYKYNPKSVVDFAPLIDTFSNISADRMKALGEVANIGNIQQDVADFKEMQGTLIDEQFNLRERANEERLAHTGRGSGTYSAESRAAMARAHGLARMEGDTKASMYGEQLASQRLERNKEAFNLQEVGRQGQLASELGKYGLYKEDEADQEQRRQAAIGEQKGMLGIGQGVVTDDLNKALQNRNVENALGEYNAVNGAQIARQNSEINRQMANYKMANENFDKQPPTMGEMALKAGATVVGTYFGGPMGGAAAYKAADSMTGSGRKNAAKG